MISSDRFPVPLPFTTALPAWFALHLLGRNGRRPPAEKIVNALERVADTLLDEDMRLYRSRLSDWLEQNPGRDDDAAHAVRLLRAFWDRQALSPYYAILVANYGSKENPPALDEEEAQLIESWVDPADPDRLKRYTEWLRSRGYPKLADRTLVLGGLQTAGDRV